MRYTSRKIKDLLLLSLVFSLALFSCNSTPDSDTTKKNKNPNIVFIYTDDQADWTLGISGNQDAHTPNIDLLAQQGAYLKNSFVTTPVCSPARASVMTSQYASEMGIYDFIPQPGHKLYDPKNPIGMNPDNITFAEVLQNAGYHTGLIGKWHLGDWTQTDNQKYHPTNNGFDYFMGLTGGGTKPENPLLEKDGKVEPFEGLTTDILTDDAIDFIKSNTESPFLLCLNYRAPHGRWLPVAPEDWAPFESMNPTLPNPDYPDLNVALAKKKMREYLASVAGIDRNVGRILDLLKSLNIDQNTIIVFSSDHGYNMGHNGITHKGNGSWITKNLPPSTENIPAKWRPNLYDNSLKVPSIVKWPGMIQPGTEIEQTTTSLDWFPTFVEMANAKLPKNKTVRGRSLLPLLRGEKVKDWDNSVYAEYSMINYAKASMRCYRTPEWKLVKDFLDPKRDELYNIAIDPKENTNLIHDPNNKSIITELEQQIFRHMESVNDTLLKNTYMKVSK